MSGLEATSSRRRLPVAALLVANAVSLIGEAITMIAIPWFVYETTGSASRMGIVGFFTIMPRVLATFFGGAIIDRIGFKPASIVADVVSGLCVGAIPLLHATGHFTFPLLLLLVFLGALFDGPGSTARESMVPDLVRMADARLERINAFYQMLQRLAVFIGPALAGVFIAYIGVTNVLWIDAATFAFSAVLIGLMVPNIRAVHVSRTATGYWQELVTGVRFILCDPLLRWFAILIGILNFCDAPLVSVLLPVLARTTYGSVERLGLMLSVLGAGAVFSSLVYASIGHRVSRRHVFVTAFVILGLPYWILAWQPPFPVVLIGLFVSGCGAGPINPILMTIRQERVPADIRGRVFSAFMALAWISIPLGQLAGGFAVESWGTSLVFGIMASVYLIVTSSAVFNPAFHAMDIGKG